MKKTIALLLVLVTMLSLAACGGKANGSLDLAKVTEALQDLQAKDESIFPSGMETDESFLKDVFGIDPASLSQHLILFPMMNVKSSALFLLLPAEGKTDEVKAAMDEYMTSYELSWDMYLPDQAALVHDRLETEIETAEGTWLVYCISTDNDAVLEAIKGAVA